MTAAPRLPIKPIARSEKVEELVAKVLRGHIRVPWFERRLAWEANHVLELFDSIVRGYPVGSLLLYRRPAKAERLEVGPLVVDGAEETEAWYVVDGQQRLTALTACLARSLPLPRKPSADDPYVLYFDVERQAFVPPVPSGEIPDAWVPLPILLDASELTEWTFQWAHGRDPDRRRVIFETGARIRESPLPLIQTEDPEAAKQIFTRTNKAGKPLEWTDIHEALFADESDSPSTLEDLAADLSRVGMGRLSADRLLTGLLALRGLDPTRSSEDHYRRSADALRDAVQEALPVLRRVLSFLRRDAAIPHLRLLPKSVLLDVLVRFFALHPNPSARSRSLLTRWFWRTALGAGIYDDRTLRRRGVAALREGDEEGSVQRLLELVSRDRRRSFDLPGAFDGRSDDDRIVLAALAHLRPRHLQTGRPIDVANLLAAEDSASFVEIVETSGVEGSRSPANRLLHPKGFPVSRLLLREQDQLFGVPVAESHAISEAALAHLRVGDLAAFLAARSAALLDVVRHFARRLADWEHNDRPSIDYLLRAADEEVAVS